MTKFCILHRLDYEFVVCVLCTMFRVAVAGLHCHSLQLSDCRKLFHNIFSLGKKSDDVDEMA